MITLKVDNLFQVLIINKLINYLIMIFHNLLVHHIRLDIKMQPIHLLAILKIKVHTSVIRIARNKEEI